MRFWERLGQVTARRISVRARAGRIYFLENSYANCGLYSRNVLQISKLVSEIPFAAINILLYSVLERGERFLPCADFFVTSISFLLFFFKWLSKKFKKKILPTLFLRPRLLLVNLLSNFLHTCVFIAF